MIKIQMTKTKNGRTQGFAPTEIRVNSCNSWAVFVLNFENLNFEFVSDFEFRASDLFFILRSRSYASRNNRW
jgi:hypothetical protein